MESKIQYINCEDKKHIVQINLKAQNVIPVESSDILLVNVLKIRKHRVQRVMTKLDVMRRELATRKHKTVNILDVNVKAIIGFSNDLHLVRSSLFVKLGTPKL